MAKSTETPSHQRVYCLEDYQCWCHKNCALHDEGLYRQVTSITRQDPANDCLFQNRNDLSNKDVQHVCCVVQLYLHTDEFQSTRTTELRSGL